MVRVSRLLNFKEFSKRKQNTDLQLITNIRALLMFTKLEKFSKQS